MDVHANENHSLKGDILKSIGMEQASEASLEDQAKEETLTIPPGLTWT